MRNDPVKWIRETLGQNLWTKQQLLTKAVFTHDRISVKSCHASGKSFTAAQIVLVYLFSYPYNSTVLTTAPTWRQVEDVLWKEIRSTYKNSRDPLGGRLLQTEFILEDKWLAVGFSTDEPDKVSGWHAEHILIIKDESSGIPKQIHDAIEGIASTGNVTILELGNPTDPTGHFANTFKSKFYEKMSITCFDTPNFEYFVKKAQSIYGPNATIDQMIDVLEQSTREERSQAIVYPYLIAPEWVYQRLDEWGRHSPMFQSRCLADFPEEGEDTLIPLRYALKAQQNNIEFDGTERIYEYLGVDVARFGSDKTVMVYRRNGKVMWVKRYSKQSTDKTAGLIAEFHLDHPNASIRIDDTGVGGGVTDMCRAEGIPVTPIVVGSKAKDDTHYGNLRAELFSVLENMFRKGEIDIPVDDDGLVADLTNLKYKFNLKGQKFIESKDELKKRGLPSPDAADALMLAFAPGDGTYSEPDEPPEPDNPYEEPQGVTITGNMLQKSF